jgi:hypothetical protein
MQMGNGYSGHPKYSAPAMWDPIEVRWHCRSNRPVAFKGETTIKEVRAVAAKTLEGGGHCPSSAVTLMRTGRLFEKENWYEIVDQSGSHADSLAGRALFGELDIKWDPHLGIWHVPINVNFDLSKCRMT